MKEKPSLLSALGNAPISRRQFFRLGAAAAVAGLGSRSALAKLMPGTAADGGAVPGLAGLESPAERTLRFYHTHTGESLKVTYWAEGDYLAGSLQEINHLLRDFRTGDVKPIAPDLLDLLSRIGNGLDATEPFQVISGYRSPATNSMLHARSSGVATHSLHMEGMAIDIRIPGRDLRRLRDFAMSQRAGGVGYYPASDFVHVDVGRVRYW